MATATANAVSPHQPEIRILVVAVTAMWLFASFVVRISLWLSIPGGLTVSSAHTSTMPLPSSLFTQTLTHRLYPPRGQHSIGGRKSPTTGCCCNANPKPMNVFNCLVRHMPVVVHRPSPYGPFTFIWACDFFVCLRQHGHGQRCSMVRTDARVLDSRNGRVNEMVSYASACHHECARLTVIYIFIWSSARLSCIAGVCGGRDS